LHTQTWNYYQISCGMNAMNYFIMTEKIILEMLPTAEEIGGSIYHRIRDDFFYHAAIRDADGLNWRNRHRYTIEDGGKYIMSFPDDIRRCQHGISIPKDDLVNCPDEEMQIVVDILTSSKKYSRKIYKGTYAITIKEALKWAEQCGYASVNWRGYVLVVPIILWKKIKDGEPQSEISGQESLWPYS